MNKESGKKNKWTRRAFMITGGVVGGGLVVGVGGLAFLNKKIKKYSGLGFDGDMLNAWVSILPDNTIQLAVPRAEMGQGVYTSIPMLIAEELEVDMEQVQVVAPQPESPYSNTFLLTSAPKDVYKGLTLMEKVYSAIPIVGTGGSTSIPDGYDSMRMAGATARTMLIQSAAKHWGIDSSLCSASRGYVINRATEERMSYGQLASAAALERIDRLPQLKSKESFRLIGTPARRLDIPAKVTGNAKFGLDVRPEGMLYAVIRHPSMVGGNITGIKNKDEVESMSGVKKVVQIDEGVAVIADNTWRAKNAALALDLDEENNGHGDLSSESISQLLDDILSAPPIAIPEDEGKVDDVFSSAEDVLEATYEVPYLAHATLEPVNCTVLYKNESLEIWVGHQASSVVQSKASERTGIKKSNIVVHTQYLGGGFGRRSEPDMVIRASAIAMAMEGIPIQLIYTREEDMKNDMYRPAVKSRFRATIKENGEITAWDNKIALQSVSNSSMKRIMPSMATKPEDDVATTEGAIHLPYLMKNRRVSFGQAELPIQVGFWRSVGNSQNGFFTECFMDECAYHTGMDPFEFRKSKLDNHPRFKNVLETVADMGNWTSSSSPDEYKGIALHKSFGSIVGQVAQISRIGENQFSIDKYFCAIDCGRIVNPDTIAAQMEGGIIFGLSAALYGEITLDNGRIQQDNFPQYEMVRMGVSPRTEVHIMEVDEYPGGVGEPGTPPAAPALVNALFAATGKRVRSLPLTKHGYSFV